MNGRLLEQKEPFTIMTGELDCYGMRCTTPLLLKEGEEMSIDILLSSSLPKLRLTGRVRWCREKTVQRHFDCGIDFIDMREDDRIFLAKHIERFAVQERRSA